MQKTAAEKMEYFGRKGYLVTITSKEENNFVTEKAQGLGWIGAEDIERKNGEARQNGDWRWVTGPEGLEDGGKDLQFYQGYYVTPVHGPVENRYTNWDNGEPNDTGGEYVAHIFGPGSKPGKWNDYAPTKSVTGYIVEYGGMPNDNNIQISATKTVNFVDVTELNQAIKNGDDLKQADYDEASWKEYQKALEDAKKHPEPNQQNPSRCGRGYESCENGARQPEAQAGGHKTGRRHCLYRKTGV
ncbi:lectin-like protein [Paenibacillus sp. JTLBN-2024]